MEQKALRKGTRGCLDAIVINEAVARETKVGQQRREGRYRLNPPPPPVFLAVAWIDYRKAYDMTPHRWIKSALKAIQAPVLIQRAIRRLIPRWKTDISVRRAKRGWEKIPVSLERGLFQGDSLSPLLFCLGIVPLSLALRKEKGFGRRHQKAPITHLLYMDDLKIYETDKETFTRTVGKVEETSRALWVCRWGCQSVRWPMPGGRGDAEGEE